MTGRLLLREKLSEPVIILYELLGTFCSIGMRQIEDLVRIMNINWAVNQLPDTFSAFRLKILMNLFRPFRLFKDLAELLSLIHI